MATLNKWFGIGHLGNNPDEIKITNDGKAYTKFSLAVDQTKGQETTWLQVTAWEKTAEAVENYARKGTSVFAQGKLQIQKYKDEQHVERTLVEISASNVQILEKKPKEGDLPDSVLPEA
jgi:single-strand DNA-binding protein